MRAGSEVCNDRVLRRYEALAVPSRLAKARRQTFDAPACGLYSIRFALVEEVRFEFAAKEIVRGDVEDCEAIAQIVFVDMPVQERL